ncbi:hypothetical protein F5880DRAFT_1580459 [Lentinula raphanica]|nr:hypothetical protein F5880DRAFT_1580459 [Lentinula raphanica]
MRLLRAATTVPSLPEGLSDDCVPFFLCSQLQAFLSKLNQVTHADCFSVIAVGKFIVSWRQFITVFSYLSHSDILSCPMIMHLELQQNVPWYSTTLYSRKRWLNICESSPGFVVDNSEEELLLMKRSTGQCISHTRTNFEASTVLRCSLVVAFRSHLILPRYSGNSQPPGLGPSPPCL